MSNCKSHFRLLSSKPSLEETTERQELNEDFDDGNETDSTTAAAELAEKYVRSRLKEPINLLNCIVSNP